MRWRDSFHPYAFTTVLTWSMAYILTRLALQHFSAFSLGFLRYLIASVVLAVVAAVTRMAPPRRRDLPWFLLSGAVGISGYMVVFNIGQAQVSAATGSVVIATAPIITALLARVFYREALRPLQWAAIAVEFLGVGILTLMNGAFSANTGLLWMFAAALALGVYNLLQKKLTREYPALRASTYSIFFGALLLTVFAPPAFGELASAPPIQYVYLGVLGIGSSALGYVCWALAFSKAEKTSQVSNYMFLTPLLASAFGFLIAGEVPDLPTLLGGGVILAGVLIFNLGGRSRDAAGTEDQPRRGGGRPA